MGYARVSTDDQRLDLQYDALIAHGVKKGDIYEDKASGAGKHRPGLTAMLLDVRKGDVLVIWKLDRLGRQLGGIIKIVDDLRVRGTDLRVLTQNIDTTTPSGKFMFHVFAAMAELERDLSRERTIAGLAAARARGRVGGRAPVLTPEKEEEARTLLRGGMPAYKVAKKIKVSQSLLYKEQNRILEGDKVVEVLDKATAAGPSTTEPTSPERPNPEGKQE